MTIVEQVGFNAEFMSLRGQLAALTRLLHREQILNYSGHASVRLPGRDAFLIQSLEESRAKVSP
ncbi:MAG: hypothetical protein V3T02_08560, partial [Alphaproteobacteria bacterium]